MVAVLCVVAFSVRAYRLDAQSLWSDESISLERASQPMATMLRRLPVEHAPLYFVLLNGWLRLAGSSDFALRYPSLWAGVLAIPLVCALGRRLLGRTAGLLCGLLLTVHPLAIWYSQEARMYALAAAAGLASLWLLVVALGRGGRRVWLGYAVAAAATIYSHYYGGIILAIGLVYGLLWLWYGWSLAGPERIVRSPARHGAGAMWLAFLAAEAGILVLFLPWLPRAVGVLGFPGWRPPLGGSELAQLLLVRLPLGATLPVGVGLWLGGVQLAMVLVGLVAAGGDLRARQRLPGAGLLLVSAAVTIAAVAAVLRWRADIHERYLLPITPLVCLAVVNGLATVWPRHRLLAIVAAMVILASDAWSLAHHYFDRRYAKPDYREYTAYIAAHATPDDALVLYGPGYFLTKRYGGERLPKVYNLLSSENRRRSAADIQALLAKVAAEHPFVWLAVQGREAGAIGEWFARHGFLSEGGWRTGLLLYRYAFAPTSDLEWATVTPLASQEGIRLAGFTRRLKLAGQDVVLVAVRIEGGDSADREPPRLSARLLDAEGTVVAAHDADCVAIVPCPSGTNETGCGYLARLALPAPEAAPDGFHRVAIVAYRGAGDRVIAEATLAQLGPSPPASP